MSEKPNTILVADADPDVRGALVEKLRTERFETIEASSGRIALEQVRRVRPDLVVTELFLPDITGLNLCRRIREDSQLPATPVVILSSYADEMDRIISFELGVDDFVAKPVSPADLLARLRAILRRLPLERRPAGEVPAAETSSVEEDVVSVARSVVDATPRELQILAELMREGGRVVTRDELLRRVWSPDASATPRAVDAHIKSLRRKMGESRDLIRTVRGVGYCYDERAPRS